MTSKSVRNSVEVNVLDLKAKLNFPVNGPQFYQIQLCEASVEHTTENMTLFFHFVARS